MKVVIIGGGLTGVTSAYELKKRNIDYLLIEQENELGGLCKTIKMNGFFFDYTGHFLHFPSSDKHVKNFVFSILKDNIIKVNRNAKIYTKYSVLDNKLIPYPFQANIKFLTPKQRKKCLYDLLGSHLNNGNNKIDNFNSWLIQNFGQSITKLFFLPYNTKLWKTKLDLITTSWVKQFVPVPDIKEVFEQVIRQDYKINYGYNVSFYYPKFNGIQALIDNIVKCLSKNNILTSAKVVKVDTKKKIVSFLHKGKVNNLYYDKLISTVPLPELGKIVNDTDIKLWTKKLQYSGVICYNIALESPVMGRIHWIYFPEKDILFYRVGFYHNINKNLTPPNKGAIYVEVAYKNVDKVNAKEIIHKIKQQLILTNIISSGKEILFYDILKIPYAYVIYDKYRDNILPQIMQKLKQNNIYSIGRYGGWKYSYMAENIKDAISTVNHIVHTK